MELKNVFVQGAGVMGSGITQAGCRVRLNDLKEDLLKKATQAIDKSLQKAVDKEKLTSDQKETCLERINTTTE